MIALSIAYGLGMTADKLALIEQLRVTANQVISHIVTAIDAFLNADTSRATKETNDQFNLVIDSANESLEQILRQLPEIFATLDQSLDRVNEAINVVQVGDPKYADSVLIAPLLILSMGLCEQMSFSFRISRKQIENANINRLVLAQTIALLQELEVKCHVLYQKLDEISSRIQIRDSMTERLLEVSGYAELDALNER